MFGENLAQIWRMNIKKATSFTYVMRYKEGKTKRAFMSSSGFALSPDTKPKDYVYIIIYIKHKREFDTRI